MLTFIERLSQVTKCTNDSQLITPLFTLSLTAEERTRSRHRFETPEGGEVFLRLPRGTVLQDGDLLRSQTGDVIQIIAKPEPVLTVRATHTLTLLRAAYHLGNRHVSLEITANYLRLSFDPVLKNLLEQMNVEIIEEIVPFRPEMGAYHEHGH